MTLLPTGQPIAAIVGLSFFSIMLQALPATDIPLLDQVGKLGADALLAAAVIVLWRKLQEKDKLLMENYRSMADALAANNSISEKMSDTLCEIKEAVERLTSARAALAEFEGRHPKHKAPGATNE